MRGLALLVSAALSTVGLQPAEPARPGAISACDALGAADAVFVGEAGPVTLRPVRQRDGRNVKVKFSPVVVERGIRGVVTPVVFVTPAGVDTFLTAGQRYLVYGRRYAGTDMFLSSDAYGTKPLDAAADDLELLDRVAATRSGATISGVLELDESDAAHPDSHLSPLPNITVRLSRGDREAVTITTADGGFQAVGLAAGTYTLQATLPEDLVLLDQPPRSTLSTSVQDGGCVSPRLRAVPNGRIAGAAKTPLGKRPSTIFFLDRD
jgi:hypothetical protein